MDYSTMSDREIDALVAERVCGWGGFGESIGRGIVGLAPDGLVHELPHFSTDANAAIQAAEKLSETWDCDIRLVADSTGWTAAFDKTMLTVTSRASESLPRAICEGMLEFLQEHEVATEPH